MGAYKYLDAVIDQKLQGIHTCYLAKVLSATDETAKIQPLGLISRADGSTEKQSVLSKVPIIPRLWNDIENEVYRVWKGDIVICICCERNITAAKSGANVATPAGHHSMSDSIIIEVFKKG